MLVNMLKNMSAGINCSVYRSILATTEMPFELIHLTDVSIGASISLS